ncbi:MAG: glycosyltransferase family 4 protein [Chloroflexi bacterium]|nr:glycosyltransferase family 4 protein [Chloroflexota bacterium]MCL5274937.1 glycosyltransferase family 4 protein [Chloroflexota bacterium]
MRILLLTQVLPYPLDSGAKVRAYYILRYLAARHQLTLVSFGRKSDSSAAVGHLSSLCHDIHIVPMDRTRSADLRSLCKSALTVQPFTIVRDERVGMRAKLAEIVVNHQFDAIHADQLAMAQYAIGAESAMRNRWPESRPLMVLDAHNAYYLIPQRMAEVSHNPLLRLMLSREARLIAKYEVDTYQLFNHVLTVTSEDLSNIKQLHQFDVDSPRFSTIPICIDAEIPCKERKPDTRGLLFLGGLHWPPNADAVRWFISEIWPMVHVEAPDSRIYIIGARPPRDIRALGDFDGIERPEQAGAAPVVVTGYVKDPASFIDDSAALIVALRSGGGMRVKIIEALQWRLPIITTAIGCEGISMTPWKDAMIADDPRQFAQSVIDVLKNPVLSRRLSENGRALVEQHYDWRKTYMALDQIYA